MNAALILLLIATALALCGRASLRVADRDGGMGAAMGTLVLFILSIAFGLVAVLKVFW